MNKTAFTIYDASAGAGKTYTLSKEYIKILLQANTNDAYKSILAITFTNKAVEEMKNRILEYVLDFAKENTSEKGKSLMHDIAKEIGLSPATIKEKSKLILKNIIHNYTNFSISTIDKFTLKIIKSFANELNIPPDFTTSIETDMLLQEAVDTIIAKAGEEEILTKQLLDFSRSKTDEDKHWDISSDLYQSSKLLTNETELQNLKSLEGKTIEDFVVTKNYLKKEIESLGTNTSLLAKEILQLLENEAINLKSFSSSYFPDHIKKIEDLGLGILDLYKYKSIDDVKINKTAKDREVILMFLPQILELLQKIYTQYSKKMLFEAFHANIYTLSLLNDIQKTFQTIQEEQNVLSISKFNKIINDEIQNQPTPFIYEKMGNRYRHFFIDEFQDTSVLQWKNSMPLIDNALSSEENGISGSLLLVGDPKQAIYRWRGGNAEQFIDLVNQESPFSNKEKEVVYLDTNYRSFTEVIQFNNSFFAFMANKLETEKYKDLYENHSFQKTNSKKEGYVNISFVDKKELEEEEEINDLFLQKTTEVIEKVLSDGFVYKDIALLVRGKKEGYLLANHLTEKGIPILSSETLLIQNATEVKLILNVLHYIHNYNNLEAKFNMLYFVSETAKTNQETHTFIAENIRLKPKELEQKFQEIAIPISFEACQKKSIYEVVEIIINAFIKENANNSYVQFFSDLVLERYIKTQSNIADFLEYWQKNGFQKSIPSPATSNAVKILTIHKSKGLEFPVVIFPFANENFSANKKETLWVNTENTEIGFEKLMINSKKGVEKYSENAEATYNTKAEEKVLDNINVLYVALTRAVEQLYVISELSINKKGDLPNKLSSYFIQYLQEKHLFKENVLEYEFGKSKKVSLQEKEEKLTKNIEVVTEKINAKAIKIAQKEALMWNTMQQDAIAFGNTLHEILAFITTKDTLEKAIQMALEKGLIKQSQSQEIRTILLQIVEHPKLQPFFAKENKILNEQPIICEKFGTIIPDKVALQNQIAYLLDYKTGIPNEKHKKQVYKYEEVLENMQFTVLEKTLVYIGEEIKIISL